MKKGILGIVMSGSLALVSSLLVSYPASASGTNFWEKKFNEVESIKNRQIDEKDREIAEKNAQIDELISKNRSLETKIAQIEKENASFTPDEYDTRTESTENRN